MKAEGDAATHDSGIVLPAAEEVEARLEAKFARAPQCGWAVCLASSQAGRKKPPKQQVSLLKSAFECLPPVLIFDYEPKCGAVRDLSRVLGEEELASMGFVDGPPKMYFYHQVSKDVHEYNSVLNTLSHAGLYRTKLDKGKFALHWGAHPAVELIRGFHPFQRANHFPSSWHIGRKDLLWRNISRMKRQFPKHFDITPNTFNLPNEHNDWCSARERNPEAFWIWKPPNSACGRGIRVLSSNVKHSVDKELSKKEGVVQRYLDNPLLLNGFKFDLRLYVVVTSYDPLRVYLNTDGLVRLATTKYSNSKDSLSQRTMHLTNYSVNKLSDAYVKNKEPDAALAKGDEDGEDEEEAGAEVASEADGAPSQAEGQAAAPEAPPASKWSFQELRDYFEVHSLDYDLMFERIKDVITKTLIAVEPSIVTTWQQGASFSGNTVHQIGPNQTCFEIYGFDVMVDDRLNAWVLEVNIFPSLSSSSPYDKRVKTRMIADTLTLAGLKPYDHDLMEQAMREERANRLQGLAPKAQGKSHSMQSISSAALRDLGEAEWRLILETQDESLRSGGFRRIYPTLEAVRANGSLFTAQRYSNLVLARWLELGGERCFLPEFRDELPPFVPRQVSFDRC